MEFIDTLKAKKFGTTAINASVMMMLSIFILSNEIALSQPMETAKSRNKESSKENVYNKPLLSKKIVQGKYKYYGIWLDEKKWINDDTLKENNPNVDIGLQHIDGDVYIIVIYERLQIRISALKKMGLDEMKRISKDSKLILDENRIINGREFICTQMEGTFQSVPMDWFSCYYSDKNGSLKIIAYTPKKLYSQYKTDITDLLSGLEIFEKGEKTQDVVFKEYKSTLYLPIRHSKLPKA